MVQRESGKSKKGPKGARRKPEPKTQPKSSGITRVRLKKDVPGVGLHGQVVKVEDTRAMTLIELQEADEYIPSPRPPKKPFPSSKHREQAATTEALPDMTEAERHMVFLKFYRAKLMEASRKSPGQMLRDLVRLGILKLDYKKAIEHPEVFNKLLDDIAALGLPKDDPEALVAKLKEQGVDAKLSTSPIFPEPVVNGIQLGPDTPRSSAMDQLWIREVQAAVKALKENGHDQGQGPRWGVMAGCHERCEDAIRVVEKFHKMLPRAMTQGPEGISSMNDSFGMFTDRMKAWDKAKEIRAGTKSLHANDFKKAQQAEREVMILKTAVALPEKIDPMTLKKGADFRTIAMAISGRIDENISTDKICRVLTAWKTTYRVANQVKKERPGLTEEAIVSETSRRLKKKRARGKPRFEEADIRRRLKYYDSALIPYASI